MGLWLFALCITSDILLASGDPEYFQDEKIVFIPPEALEAELEANRTGQVHRLAVEDELISKVGKDWWDEVTDRLVNLKARDQVPISVFGDDMLALKAEFDAEMARRADLKFLAWMIARVKRTSGEARSIDRVESSAIRHNLRYWKAAATRYDMMESMELDNEKTWVKQAASCHETVDKLKLGLKQISMESKKTDSEIQVAQQSRAQMPNSAPNEEVPSSVPEIESVPNAELPGSAPTVDSAPNAELPSSVPNAELPSSAPNVEMPRIAPNVQVSPSLTTQLPGLELDTIATTTPDLVVAKGFMNQWITR